MASIYKMNSVSISNSRCRVRLKNSPKRVNVTTFLYQRTMLEKEESIFNEGSFFGREAIHLLLPRDDFLSSSGSRSES
jgi:hypothetical protein